MGISNQGLNRVLEFQAPTVYFRKLSRWFNEGFWSQTSPSGTVQGPVAPATRAIEGYRSTSDYNRSQGRNQRRVAAMQRPLRVHWSHTVPDWNVSFSEVEVEQGVSTVVECCKPEWIDKG